MLLRSRFELVIHPPIKEITQMKIVRAASLVLSLLGTLSLPHAAMADTPEPYPIKGQVIQTLKAFDNPEGAIFSEDGKHVFISNAAELGMPDKGFHWTERHGYISKLAVQDDGTLKMVNEKLLYGFTAPLGMAINPVATKRFPKGSIFLCVGAAPIATADGEHIKDPTRVFPAIVVFDEEGELLGQLKMGLGSVFGKKTSAVATLPNAIGFDKVGNLYIADTGIGGGAFEPNVPTASGIWMVPLKSIDIIANGWNADVHFIPMPEGGPDGMEVAPDGSIHTNTVGVAAGMKDPAQGGMYKLTTEDFINGRLPEPFAKDFGALDGLTFVGDVRLDTEIKNTNSVLVTPTGGKTMMLTYDDADKKLAGPADIAVREMPDGSWLLVIPELSATSPNNADNAVTVVKLPANFAAGK
jgi:hypothetical protein